MRPPPLRQLFKTRFENSNSTYTNALSNLSEKQLTFYRKALKDISKTLVEAVSELWKERVEEIKKLEPKQTPTPNESDFSQGKRHSLLANQPTIESFWQTPTTVTISTLTPHKDTTSATASHDKPATIQNTDEAAEHRRILSEDPAGRRSH